MTDPDLDSMGAVWKPDIEDFLAELRQARFDPFDPSQGKNLVPKKPVLPSNPYPIALNESIGPANGWLMYDIVTLDGTAYMLNGKLLDPTMMTELEQAEEAEKYIEQKYLEHPPLGRSPKPEAPGSQGTRWDWLMF